MGFCNFCFVLFIFLCSLMNMYFRLLFDLGLIEVIFVLCFFSFLVFCFRYFNFFVDFFVKLISLFFDIYLNFVLDELLFGLFFLDFKVLR